MDIPQGDDDEQNSRESEDVDPNHSNDPSIIPPKEPAERLKQWRIVTFHLNASRRFRYALDFKKFEEHQRLKKDPTSRFRVVTHVIRAVERFKLAGSGADLQANSKLGTGDLYTDLRSGTCLIQVPPIFTLDDTHTKDTESLFKDIDQLFASCPPSNVFGARVIGLHGKSGIGKTTLCKSLYNYYHAECSGKVSIVKLIEHGRQQTLKNTSKTMRRVLRELTGARSGRLSFLTNKVQRTNSLKERIPRCDVFLAIDNVWHDWDSKEEAKTYLQLGFTSASKVLVTSENHETLLHLGIAESCCFGMFPFSVMDECLPDPDAIRIIASKRPRRNIFLSAGDPQEDFAEKFCADLREAKQSAFFNKRLQSLPEGEEFGQLIFTVTQECELVVVVLSEEYFTRSKWQMLALGVIMKYIKYTSRNMKFLLLYYGLTCEEFKSPERREKWFQVWKEWSKLDNRISVDQWNRVLWELDRRNGMEYVKANGEVIYRKAILTTVCGMLQQRSQEVVSRGDFPHEPRRHFYKNQCRVLKGRLLIAEETLNRKPSPNDDSSVDILWPQAALTELRRVVKLGNALIEGCQNEPCLKAYLRLGERTNAFVETLKELVWCLSFVFYHNTVPQLNPSIALEDFPVPYSMARVGEAEHYLLESAALADQKELLASLDRWIKNHSCSANECGRPSSEHESDDPLMCLATQILARVSNGDGDLVTDVEADHKSVLWKTTQEALEDGRKIGKGSSGTVFKTTWLGDKYAKKEFQWTVDVENEAEAFACFENEVKALAKLNHPHIVKVSAYSVDSSPCFFLMERMPHDLREYMKKRMKPRIDPPFSILASIDLMLQISEAMNYINSQGMVYRDLKADNILVKAVDDHELCKDGFVVAKLADFGLAKSKNAITSHLTQDNQGTTLWRAPEMYRAAKARENEGTSRKWRAPEMFRGSKAVDAKLSYPRQSDVYSFGIVCFEILTGKFPFHHVPMKKLYEMITDSEHPLRPELPTRCPESLASLIRQCWHTDPRERPTFTKISMTLRYLKGSLMLAGK